MPSYSITFYAMSEGKKKFVKGVLLTSLALLAIPLLIVLVGALDARFGGRVARLIPDLVTECGSPFLLAGIPLGLAGLIYSIKEYRIDTMVRHRDYGIAGIAYPNFYLNLAWILFAFLGLFGVRAAWNEASAALRRTPPPKGPPEVWASVIDGDVLGVAFGPDGELLARTSKGLLVWDAATHQPRKAPSTPQDLFPVSKAYRGGGEELVMGSTRLVPRKISGLGAQLLDPTSAFQNYLSWYNLEGHKGLVLCVACSADSKLALSGGEDGTVVVWDLTTRRQRHCLRGHESQVYCVALSADSRLAVSGSADNTVRVWDLETGKQKQLLDSQAPTVERVTFSPDARLVLSIQDDGSLTTWEVANGSRRMHFAGGFTSFSRHVALSNDGRSVLISDNNQIKLFALEED